MNYEINHDTQVILPISAKKSKIVDNNNEYIVDESVQKIMEYSCEYFGSSFEGRKEGTKKLLGITHKSPIIVEETERLIFFPTKSPDSSECMWINLNKIEKHYSIDKDTTAIVFKNGDILEVEISLGSLTNQILRATRLKYVLDERIKKKDK